MYVMLTLMVPGDIILGVSGGPRGSHEPGVVGIDKNSGEIIFAYEEERFNRYKTSISCFPTHSLRQALKRELQDQKRIMVTSSPGVTYSDMHKRWPKYLNHNFGIDAPHRSYHHQLCHAASSFYSSNFDEAVIVSLDGIGDTKSGVIAIGRGHKIRPVRYLNSDESLGFYWALMCQHLGYDGLEDAYKVMGLAPYGSPIFNLDDLLTYTNGKFWLNQKMVLSHGSSVSKHPSEPISGPSKPGSLSTLKRRLPHEEINQEHMNIAASAQAHLEQKLFAFLEDLQSKHCQRNLCMAGGVSLNSHFMGWYHSNSTFDKIYVPPCAGDSGLALGAAQLCYSMVERKRPKPLKNAYTGSRYSDEEVIVEIERSGYVHNKEKPKEVAIKLAQHYVIAQFTDRAELGPRALGNRSILASPQKAEMKDILNSKIKFRESYRPFAPVVMEDQFEKYFYRGSLHLEYMSGAVIAKSITKEIAPAIVHIDNTCRVQVAKKGTPLYELIEQFNKLTGCPILLNTSFNLKGEPNVESPRDAIRTFASSGIDYLYINNFLVQKPYQTR